MQKIYSDSKFTIYEQSPSKRSIFLDGDPVFLCFPYIIFIVIYIGYHEYKLYAFASLKSLNDENQKFTLLPLPNILCNGKVCLGDRFNPNCPEELIDYFWNSNFTKIVGSYWISDFAKKWKENSLEFSEWEHTVELPKFQLNNFNFFGKIERTLQ